MVVGWRRGGVVENCGWLCVLKEVWGRGTDRGGCGWKDVGMVATW